MHHLEILVPFVVVIPSLPLALVHWQQECTLGHSDSGSPIVPICTHTAHQKSGIGSVVLSTPWIECRSKYATTLLVFHLLLKSVTELSCNTIHCVASVWTHAIRNQLYLYILVLPPSVDRYVSLVVLTLATTRKVWRRHHVV